MGVPNPFRGWKSINIRSASTMMIAMFEIVMPAFVIFQDMEFLIDALIYRKPSTASMLLKSGEAESHKVVMNMARGMILVIGTVKKDLSFCRAWLILSISTILIGIYEFLLNSTVQGSISSYTTDRTSWFGPTNIKVDIVKMNVPSIISTFLQILFCGVVLAFISELKKANSRVNSVKAVIPLSDCLLDSKTNKCQPNSREMTSYTATIPISINFRMVNNLPTSINVKTPCTIEEMHVHSS